MCRFGLIISIFLFGCASVNPGPVKWGEALNAPSPINPDDICKAGMERQYCWFELKSPRACYFWRKFHTKADAKLEITWSGSCQSGSPHGKGTLNRSHYNYRYKIKGTSEIMVEDYIVIAAGEMNYGRMHGKWFVTEPKNNTLQIQNWRYGIPSGAWFIQQGNGPCFKITYNRVGKLERNEKVDPKFCDPKRK